MYKKQLNLNIWVTWLAGVMVGENARIDEPTCAKSFNGQDLAKRNIEHTRLLTMTCAALKLQGAALRIEDRNAFYFNHYSGAVIAGRPDVVSLAEGIATVHDCKTGQPKLADQVQIMVYMMLLPYCFAELAVYSVRGKIVYPTRDVEIAPSAIDSRFEDNFDYFVNLIASAVPSNPCPDRRDVWGSIT